MSDSQTTTETRDERRTPTQVTRLVFPHGVANLTIRVDATMTETYRAEFYGPKPQVNEGDGVISIDYPRFNPLTWGRTSADIRISPSTAWAFEIRDGVSHWDADLRQAAVTGIDVHGGVSQLDFQLPRPAGAVGVRVSGGASKMRLRRPAGVPARLAVGGGASKLGLDDQFFGAVGGPIHLETPGYTNDVDRYEIEIGGGASKISVTRQ